MSSYSKGPQAPANSASTSRSLDGASTSPILVDVSHKSTSLETEIKPKEVNQKP